VEQRVTVQLSVLVAGEGDGLGDDPVECGLRGRAERSFTTTAAMTQ
jgi:hypothetical protein